MSDEQTPAGFEFPALTGAQKVVLACVPIAVAACVLGLASTGAANTLVLGDPGTFVRFALPIARVVHDLFDHYAGTGAVLATYHGSAEFRLKRKVRESKQKRRGR